MTPTRIALLSADVLVVAVKNGPNRDYLWPVKAHNFAEHSRIFNTANKNCKMYFLSRLYSSNTMDCIMLLVNMLHAFCSKNILEIYSKARSISFSLR